MDFKKMFVSSVGGLKDTAAAQAEFQKLIAGADGKITIPDDPDEKREWFCQTVWKAAETGKSLKDVIKLISHLKTPAGSILGEKLAMTIVRHAVEAKRNDLIAAVIPGVQKLEEADQKRVYAAFWAMKDTVKVNGEEAPVCVVTGYKNAVDVFKRLVVAGKKMHKIVEKTPDGADETKEGKEFNAACAEMQKLADELKAARPNIKTQTSKFFDINSNGQGRGRGSNIYTGISSELSFMD